MKNTKQPITPNLKPLVPAVIITAIVALSLYSKFVGVLVGSLIITTVLLTISEIIAGISFIGRHEPTYITFLDWLLYGRHKK